MTGRNPIPLSLDKPFRFTHPLDLEDARQACRECAESRRQAREWKQRAMQAEVDGEHAYRKLRAQAWLQAPEGTAKMREDWVNDFTADARRERDIAVRIVKSADERLAEIDGERASLHKLIEFSIRVTSAGEPAPDGEVIGARRA